MKRSILCSVLLCLFLFSCLNKKETETPIQTQSVAEKSYTPELKTLHISHEILLSSPYPDNMQGVWGNLFYLKSLKEYNSVSKALEKIKFDTDIKIGRDLVLALRPQYDEPTEFDTTKFSLVRVGFDSLYVRSKNTGDKQLYFKLMSLPDSVLWNLYANESYSAIAHMEWMWFEGQYEMVSENNKSTSEVLFYRDGTVKGLQYKFYSFGVDVDGKDYICLSNRDYYDCSYFLIENQQDGLFLCYNVGDVDDWEYPFEKTTLAFKLKRLHGR